MVERPRYTLGGVGARYTQVVYEPGIPQGVDQAAYIPQGVVVGLPVRVVGLSVRVVGLPVRVVGLPVCSVYPG